MTDKHVRRALWIGLLPLVALLGHACRLHGGEDSRLCDARLPYVETHHERGP